MQSSSLGILTQDLMAAGMPVGVEDAEEIIRAAGWKCTGATLLIASMLKKAIGGDVNAAKLIREMNGESAGDSGSADFSQMSDAELRRMAEGEALMIRKDDKYIGETSAGSTDISIYKVEGIINMDTGEGKGKTPAGSTDTGCDKPDGAIEMDTVEGKVDTAGEGMIVSSHIKSSKNDNHSAAHPARNDSDKGSFYKGYGCAAPW